MAEKMLVLPNLTAETAERSMGFGENRYKYTWRAVSLKPDQFHSDYGEEKKIWLG